MAINFLALPALQDPGGYNFNPLAQGLDAIREGKKDNRLLDIKQQAADLDTKRFGLQERQFGAQQEQVQAERLGNQAMAALNLEGPARAAAHARIMASHPNAANLPEAYRDPNTGLQLIAADYGKFKDRLAEDIKRAQLSHSLGSERRAQESHELAKDAASIGQYDPEKQLYRKRKDGSIEWITPPAGAEGAPPSEKTIKSEAELRKEYTGQQHVKEYQTVRNAYTNVKNAAKDPSAAGDLSMIFAYMKILDPNSVVREQEFANAQNAAGVPDRIANLYNRLLAGERLNPTQRTDFINQAEKLHASSRRQYESVRDQFGRIAKGAKARPDQVMVDFGIVPDPNESGIQKANVTPAAAAPLRENKPADAPTPDMRSGLDYNAIPPGSKYIDPQGNVRQKR